MTAVTLLQAFAVVVLASVLYLERGIARAVEEGAQ